MRGAAWSSFLFFFLLLSASLSVAQVPEINDNDVASLMTGKQKAVLIDARNPEEYQSGHIPGALNIPAERMKTEPARLPKDKATPIIFYCRGAG